MHYYQFNIGDYAAHTKGLSPIEDIAYRRMMDEYYLHEQPLNGCSSDVARLIGMREFEDEIAYILSRFFTEKDGQWIHKRIESEIKAYHDQQKAKSKAGKASAKARKRKGSEQVCNSRSTGVKSRSDSVEQTNNHKPRTINQEPNNKDMSDDISVCSIEPDRKAMFKELWDGWPKGCGEKGSRKNAEAQFIKLKPDKPLFDEIIKARDDQARDKARKASNGEFAPNFPHVERWIKHRRWEDEIDPFSQPGTGRQLSKAERDRQAADDFYARLDEQIAASEAPEDDQPMLGDLEIPPPGDGGDRQ